MKLPHQYFHRMLLFCFRNEYMYREETIVQFESSYNKSKFFPFVLLPFLHFQDMSPPCGFCMDPVTEKLRSKQLATLWRKIRLTERNRTIWRKLCTAIQNWSLYRVTQNPACILIFGQNTPKVTFLVSGLQTWSLIYKSQLVNLVLTLECVDRIT